MIKLISWAFAAGFWYAHGQHYIGLTELLRTVAFYVSWFMAAKQAVYLALTQWSEDYEEEDE